MLKDIGMDHSVLDPIDESEAQFDYDGLDILATTLLEGILSGFTSNKKIGLSNHDLNIWQKLFICSKGGLPFIEHKITTEFSGATDGECISSATDALMRNQSLLIADDLDIDLYLSPNSASATLLSTPS
ncbi:hypothetical protein K438DRAFT_1767205 [Mycena galopus ATCC 62051]|nr:hypothetical protein K438DRAFT_1767205 [Mycena galopus ATCC 62051]